MTTKQAQRTPVHTPTPWHIRNTSVLVGIIETGHPTVIGKAAYVEDADFIILACNAYDAHLARIAELEAALRSVVKDAESRINVPYDSMTAETLRIARAVLAKGAA